MSKFIKSFTKVNDQTTKPIEYKIGHFTAQTLAIIITIIVLLVLVKWS